MYTSSNQLSSDLHQTSNQLSSDLQQTSNQLASYMNTSSNQLSSDLQATSNQISVNITNTSNVILAEVRYTNNALNTSIVELNELIVNNLNNASDDLNFSLTFTSNQISNRITNLNADLIADGNTNQFITNKQYNDDLTVNGTLTTTNLNVIGNTTTINTSTYSTENMEIITESLDGPAMKIIQNSTKDIIQLFDGITNVMSINKTGNVGIGTTLPSEKLDIIGNIKLTGSFNSITNTQLGYLSDISSPLQTQINTLNSDMASASNQISNRITTTDSNASNYTSFVNSRLTTLDSNASNYTSATSNQMTNRISILDSNASNYTSATSNQITNRISILDSNASNYTSLTSNQITNRISILDSNASNYTSLTSNQISNRISILDSNASNYTSQTSNQISNRISILDSNASNYTSATSNQMTNRISILDSNASNYTSATSNQITNRISILDISASNYTSATSNQITNRISILDSNASNYTSATSNQMTNRISILDSNASNYTSATSNQITNRISILDISASNYTSQTSNQITNRISILDSNASNYTSQTSNQMTNRISILDSNASNYTSQTSNQITNRITILDSNVSNYITKVQITASQWTTNTGFINYNNVQVYPSEIRINNPVGVVIPSWVWYQFKSGLLSLDSSGNERVLINNGGIYALDSGKNSILLESGDDASFTNADWSSFTDLSISGWFKTTAITGETLLDFDATTTSTTQKYPPTALTTTGSQTDNTKSKTLSGQSYGNGTYAIDWSSDYGEYRPSLLFDGVNSGGPGGHTGRGGYSQSTGDYTQSTPQFIVSGYNGDWIKITLPNAIYLSSVKIYQRSGFVNRSPKDFRIYGTNDGTNWTQLIDVVSASYTSLIHTANNSAQSTSYTTFAIVINKIFANNHVDGNVNFDELEFYGYTKTIRNLSVKKVANNFSFQINNTQILALPFDYTKWTHILWNIANSSANGFVRLSTTEIGTENIYTKVLPTSGSYVNKLGSITNVSSLNISDFRILTIPLTPTIKSELYSPTILYSTLVDDAYLTSTSNLISSRTTILDSNASNYTLATSNQITNRITILDSNVSNYTSTTSNQITNRISILDSNVSNYTSATSNQISNRISILDSNASNYTSQTSNQITNRITILDSNGSNYIVATSNQISNRISILDSNASNYTSQTSNQITNRITMLDSNVSNYISTKTQITSSQWTTNTDYISFNNIQVYPSEIRINNPFGIVIPSWVWYQFKSGLLVIDSSGNERVLINNGGIYALDSGKNSILLESGDDASFTNADWSTFSDLTVSGWFKASALADGDKLLEFKSSEIQHPFTIPAGITPVAIGSSGDYYVAFTSTSPYSITFTRNTACQIFMIGAGGGGGDNHAGGGGSGAYYFNNNYNLNAGTYTFKVGNGGTGQVNGSTSPSQTGEDTFIQQSSADVFRCKGGGYGGSHTGNSTHYNGGTGGCGGGGLGWDENTTGTRTYTGGATNNAGTVGIGFAGGDGYNAYSINTISGGGGGGVGSVGQSVSSTQREGGNGGNALVFSIKGFEEVYGGGGGGGEWPPHTAAPAGQGGGATLTNGTFVKVGGDAQRAEGTAGGNGNANTGSGGGSGKGGNGGSGGSGIIIIRYNALVEKNIVIKKVSTNISFQINNTQIYSTPSFANNTWTHILWNIANSSVNGFVRLSTTSVGDENTYTKVIPTSGSYVNKLGSITNVSSLNISDFRILTIPLTPTIKSEVYSPTILYSTLVDDAYLTSTSNLISSRTTILDSNASNYTLSTSNQIVSRLNSLNTDNVNQGTSNRFITNHEYSNNLRIYGTLTTSNLNVIGTTTTITTATYQTENLEIISQANDGPGIKVVQNGTQDIAQFFDATVNVMTIRDGGNVGIGSTLPSEKLDVVGNIKLSGSINNTSSNEIEYVKGVTSPIQQQISTNSNLISNRITTLDSNASNYSLTTSNQITNRITILDSNASNYTLATSNHITNRITILDSNASNYSLTTSNQITNRITILDSNASNYTLSASNQITNRITMLDSNASNYSLTTSNQIANRITILDSNISNYISTKSSTSGGTSQWSTNTDFINYNNIQVYPSEIRINNPAGVVIPSWVWYQFKSGLLSLDSSGNERALINNGGIYALDSGRNSILLETGDDASFTNANWSTFTDLSISGWFKTSALADGDKLLDFTYSYQGEPDFVSNTTDMICWYKFNIVAPNTDNDDLNIDASGKTPSRALTRTNATINISDFMRGDASANFTGNSYLQVANDGTFSPDNFTIACWCKIVQASSSIQTIASCRGTNAGNNGWIIYVNNNNLEFWTGSGIAGTWSPGSVSANFASSPAVWRHLVITFVKSSGEAKVYVNNVLITTTTRPYVNNIVNNLRIGAGANEETTPLFYLVNGSLIDDFRMYNRILSTDEISKLYTYTETKYNSLNIKKVANNFSFQINNTPIYTTPSTNNTWTHILWNIANSSANGFVRLSTNTVGTENTYTKVLPTSGSYVNKLGSITNVSSLNISDFRILTIPLTTTIKSELYSPTILYSTLVDDAYLTSTSNLISSRTTMLDSNASNYTLSTSNQIVSRLNSLNTDNVNQGTSNRFITNHEYSNNLRIYGTLTTSNLNVIGTTTTITTATYQTENLEIISQANDGPGIKVVQNGTQDIAQFFDATVNVMTIRDGGNVGIGSTLPSEKLDVVGNIKLSGSINNTSSNEIEYVKGVTSPIQQQISTNSNLISNRITILDSNASNYTLSASNQIANRITILDSNISNYISTKSSTSGGTSSQWTTNTGFINYNNVQVYPSEIRINNPAGVVIPSWVWYQFKSGLLVIDSSGNDRLLNNNGGVYALDSGKNSILLETGDDVSLANADWSTFTDLAISGWFKASALADGDKLLEFVASVEETQEYPPASLNNAGTATDVSLTLSGQLYGNGTYRMIVSSAFNTSFPVKNVFNKQSPYEEFWGSSGSTGFLYNTTTGVYSGNTSTTYNTSLTYSGEWCQIQFPNQILLKSYSLVGQVNTTVSAVQNRSPKNFIILGSNNGTSWFLLDTQTNITGWGNTGTVKTFNLTNNNTQYSYYRICCNSTQGGQYSEILAISEWKLFNYVPPINILIKKASTNLSFQINNTPIYTTPSTNNTWTHILWNIANSSANGFVRLSTNTVGTENTYTKVIPTSGSYTNRLGSVTNVSSLNISDFRILTIPLTTTIKSELYSPTILYSTLVDDAYLTSTSNLISSRTTMLDSNASNYTLTTSNQLTNRLNTLNTDNVNQGTSNRFITNHEYSNSLRIYGTLTTSNLNVIGTTTTITTATYQTENLEIISQANDGPGIKIVQNGTQDIAQFFDANVNVMTIRDGGNVGIGSTLPSEKLDVIGNIKLSGSINNTSSNEIEYVKGVTSPIQQQISTNSNLISNRITTLDSNVSNYTLATSNQITNRITILDSNISNYISTKSSTSGGTSSQWTTNTGFINYNNVQVYPSEIRINNPVGVVIPSWVWYQFKSGLLVIDSSGNDRLLQNNGGIYALDSGRNSILLETGDDASLANADWSTFTDLSISGWFKTSGLMDGDILIDFSYSYQSEPAFVSDTTNLYFWYKFDSVDFLKNFGLAGITYNLTQTGSSLSITSDKKFGDGCIQTGTGKYVAIPSYNYTTQFTSALSISLWVLKTGAVVNYETVFAANGASISGGGTIYFQRIGTDSSTFAIHAFGYAVQVNIGGISTASWNHFVFVFEKTGATTMQVKFYKNNTIIQNVSATATWNPTIGSILIGAENSAGYNFSGKIDDFRIYNKALTATEISQLYTYAETRYNSINMKKLPSGLSLQVNSTPVKTLAFANNTWTHILWNIISSSSVNGFVRLSTTSIGIEDTYTEVIPTSGTYINKLGSITNVSSINISDFRILTQPLTSTIKSELYSPTPTYTTLVDDSYVSSNFVNTSNWINANFVSTSNNFVNTSNWINANFVSTSNNFVNTSNWINANFVSTSNNFVNTSNWINANFVSTSNNFVNTSNWIRANFVSTSNNFVNTSNWINANFVSTSNNFVNTSNWINANFVSTSNNFVNTSNWINANFVSTSNNFVNTSNWINSKQNTLTAGTGINIVGSTISATGGGGGSSQWTTANNNIYYTLGNVGIGTSSFGTNELEIYGGDLNITLGNIKKTTLASGSPQPAVWYQFEQDPLVTNTLNDSNVLGTKYDLTNSCNFAFFNDTTDLQVWYKFDSGDISGTTVTDYSGKSGRNGTTSGNPSIDTSVKVTGTGALSLVSTSSQYVEVSLLKTLFQTNFTISFWAYRVSNNAVQVPFSYGDSTSASVANSYIISYFINDNSVNFGYFDSANNITVASASIVNTWTHYVYVYRGNTSINQYYINNILRANKVSSGLFNATGSPAGASLPFRVGRTTHRADNAQYWNGKIDDFRIYSKALNETEIAALYGYGALTKVPNYNTVFFNDTTSLEAWYKFDNNSTDMLLDSSTKSGSRSLTNVNGCTFESTEKVRGTGSIRLNRSLSPKPYLTIPSAVTSIISSTAAANGITFSLWMKNINTLDQGRLFEFSNSTGATNAIIFLRDGAEDNYAFILKSNNTQVFVARKVLDKTWHHIVWTISNGNISTIYIDNVSTTILAQGTMPTLTGTPRGYVGQTLYAFEIINDPSAYTFGGYIDDFRIHNKVLTPTEVAALYNYSDLNGQLSYTANNYLYQNAYLWNGSPTVAADNVFLQYSGSVTNIQTLLNTFHTNGGFSIHFVFKTTSTTSTTSQILFIGNTAAGDLIRVFITNATLSFKVGVASATSTTNLSANTNYVTDLLFTYAAGGNMSLTIYLNGISSGTSTNVAYGNLLSSVDTTGLVYYIGKYTDTNDATPVILQDFRIYASAITAPLLQSLQYGNTSSVHPTISVNGVNQVATWITGNDYYYAFTQTGVTNTITFSQPTVCDVLVVGGGGSGATRTGGGGGAGALIYVTQQTLSTGAYNISVGAGGASNPAETSGYTSSDGKDGGPSYIRNSLGNDIYLARGGGGGGDNSINPINGRSGGSSGGGTTQGSSALSLRFSDPVLSTNIVTLAGVTNTSKAPDGSTVYGNIGGSGDSNFPSIDHGFSSAGGGGAGSVGLNAGPFSGNASGGAGGNGITNNITGVANPYAAGGGGGIVGSSTGSIGSGGSAGSIKIGGDGSKGLNNAVNGSNNTGSGGGGSGFSGVAAGASGAGGSGIVIIRYTAPQVASTIPTTEEYQIKRWNDSPQYGSTSGTKFITYTDGNVGIGTTVANEKLDIFGNIKVIGKIAIGTSNIADNTVLQVNGGDLNITNGYIKKTTVGAISILNPVVWYQFGETPTSGTIITDSNTSLVKYDLTTVSTVNNFYTDTTNLYFWYKFDSTNLLLNSGNTGATHNLTSAGSVAIDTVDFETGTASANFTGQGVLTIPSYASYTTNFASAVTVAFWLKIVSTTGTTSDSVVDTNSTNLFSFKRNGTNSTIDVRVANNTFTGIVSGFWTADSATWKHCVVVGKKNASNFVEIIVYVNGLAVYTSAASAGIWAVTNSQTIGLSKNAATDYMIGKLDDFRIYNKALSSQEINVIYGSGLVSKVTGYTTNSYLYQNAFLWNGNAGSSSDNIYLAYNGGTANIQTLLNSFHISGAFSIHFVFQTSTITSVSQMLYIANNAGDLVRVYITNATLTFKVGTAVAQAAILANTPYVADLTWSYAAGGNMSLIVYLNNVSVATNTSTAYNNLLLSANVSQSGLVYYIGRSVDVCLPINSSPATGTYLVGFSTLKPTSSINLGPDGTNFSVTLSPSNLAFGEAFVSNGSSIVNAYTIPRGYQVWRVPRTGTYEFVIAGAQGSSQTVSSTLYRGGYGATINTSVTLTKGDFVIILVGIAPGTATESGVSGGGGGTFVTRYSATGNFNLSTQHTIIGVAGGGGGSGDGYGNASANRVGVDASFSTSATASRNGTGAVATNGGGGGANGGAGGNGTSATTVNAIGSGAGGGGFIGNGATAYISSESTTGGLSFLNGGTGGVAINKPNCGFGGGGGAWNSGGGGGGYSGGQGEVGSFDGGGGGGGSCINSSGTISNATAYTSANWNTSKFGTARSDASGYNVGDGYVLVYFTDGCVRFASSSSTYLQDFRVYADNILTDATNITSLQTGTTNISKVNNALTEDYQIMRWRDSTSYYSSPSKFITYIDGNVGIGTNNPLTKLHVGTGTFSSGTQNMRYFNYATAETAGSTTLTDTCSVFDSSIWVKSFIGSSSDTRIKKNIEDINDDTALQKILAIEPKKYNYIDPDRGTSNIYGFLAQQIREVIPEAVTLHSDLVPNIFSVAKCNGNIITFDAPDIFTSNIEISELTSNLTIVTGYTSNLVVSDTTSNIYITEDTSNIIIDITTTSNLTIITGYTSNVSDSDSTSNTYVTTDTSNVMIDIMTSSNMTIVTGYTSNISIIDSTSNIYITEDTSNIIIDITITSNLIITSTKVPPAFFNNLKLYNQLDIIDAYGYRDTYLVTDISPDTASLKLNREIASDTVFVYGTQVNDFHTIDKSYIYTLNVCATQTLSEKVVSQNNQITQLTDIISDLTARIKALEQK
jgi:hypothetical protein